MGQAKLYTGLHVATHRVTHNGAPLDDRLDNLARALRRAGYAPTLFGYTDTALDPRTRHPADPALDGYEQVLPGFDVGASLPEHERPWLAWLDARRGRASRDGLPRFADATAAHAVSPEPGERVPRRAPGYAADETPTAFLAGAFLDWHRARDPDRPWCAHLSFIRPHPPFVAPAPWHQAFDAQAGPPPLPVPAPGSRLAGWPPLAHLRRTQRLGDFLPGASGPVAALDERDFRRVRALYHGAIAEVDAVLGTLFDALRARGDWDRTLVVVTSDHGEAMGDHGAFGKSLPFASAHRVPLVVRMPAPGVPARAPTRPAVPRPGGRRVTDPTSSVDVLPTLLDLFGVAPGHAPDGRSFAPLLRGEPAAYAARDELVWEQDLAPHAVEILGRAVDPRATVVTALRAGGHLHVRSPCLPPLTFDLARDGGAIDRHDDPAYRAARDEGTARLLDWSLRARARPGRSRGAA